MTAASGLLDLKWWPLVARHIEDLMLAYHGMEQHDEYHDDAADAGVDTSSAEPGALGCSLCADRLRRLRAVITEGEG